MLLVAALISFGFVAIWPARISAQVQDEPKRDPLALARAMAPHTHIFRKLLHKAGCTPLTSLREMKNNPEECVLILLGDTSILASTMKESFIEQGGAVLVATDRRASLPAFDVQVTGESVVVPDNSPFAYKKSVECITVQPNGKGLPIFQGLDRVVTNRPSYLFRTRQAPPRLPTWASFPEESYRVPDRGRNLLKIVPDVPLPFAAGGTFGKGRLLVLADHSVFINAMLWQRDIDNLEFTEKCIQWLTDKEDGRRKYVLFMEEGSPRLDFDVPMKEVPWPPLESVVQAVNQGLRGMEEENRFNDMLADTFGSMDRAKVLQLLAAVLTIGLVVFCVIRLMHARHRLEAGVPLLNTGLKQLVSAASLVDQRQRSMIREGNFWEAARVLARQAFAGVLASQNGSAVKRTRHTPRLLPPLHVQGNWKQSRIWKRQVSWLWKLAYGDEPIAVSARKLAEVTAMVEQFHKARADGLVQFGEAPPSGGS
jgi:hypothetical protein